MADDKSPPSAEGPPTQNELGEPIAFPVTGDEEAPLTVTTPKQRKRAFVVLFLSLICLGMGGTIMFAVLPQIARDQLGFTETETGYLFVMSGTAWVIAAPFWGRRSDLWGRRPVILIGLLAFAVSSTLFPLAIQAGVSGLISKEWTFALMALARVIFGLMGGGAMVGAQAYIVDRTARSDRTTAIATLGASFGVGQVLGPGIGAMLVVFGLLAPFYALAFLAFVSALAIWFLLPERTPPRRHERTRGMSPLDPRIATFVLFSVVLGTVQAIPTQTIGFYMADVLRIDHKAAVQMVGVGLMASGMAALFAQLVVVQRFKMPAGGLIRWGLFISLLSGILLVWARDYGPLVTALVLSGLGFGMVRPGLSAASSLSVGRLEQGAVAGVMSGMGSLGFVLCPLLAMPLYGVRPQLPYIVSVGVLAALMALNLFLPAFKRDLHRAPEEKDVSSVERG